MSRASNACDISPKVRQRVLDRDNRQCVICGQGRCLEIAHYVPRSQLGLGIPQNLVVLCKQCHTDFDNGSKRIEYGQLIRDHLKESYPEWNEKGLTYNKYKWLEASDED